MVTDAVDGMGLEFLGRRLRGSCSFLYTTRRSSIVTMVSPNARRRSEGGVEGEGEQMYLEELKP